MLEFPNINLPKYFTRLLRVDMDSTSIHYKNLEQKAHTNPALYGLFKMTFWDIDPDIDVKFVLKNLGWFGVRDRLVSQFLDYLVKGKFSEVPQSVNTKDILVLEEKLKSATLQGFSRGYLLGFYLKAWSLSDGSNKIQELIYDKVFDYIIRMNCSLIKIDWLVLTLIHLDEFLGKVELIKHIENGDPFESIIKKLGDKERAIFYNNSLKYGSSIDDLETFTGKRVQ